MKLLPRLSARTSVLVVTAPAGTPVFVDGVLAGQGPRVAVAAQAGSHEVMAIVAGKKVKKTVAFPATRAVELP